MATTTRKPSRSGPRVLVVGAGAVGLCTALALAEQGAHVTLIERGLPGVANSTKTGGGIREQFGTEVNIVLSKLSAPIWATFHERFEVDPCFRPIGYLFLAKTDVEAAAIQVQVALQNSLGVDSFWLDGAQVERRWPALAGRDIVGAGFRQKDGWANHHRIIDGLYRGALSAGVEVLVGTEALQLVESAGKVSGVVTTGGTLAGDAVVLATGPWGATLLEPLGQRVAVAAHPHQLLIVEPSQTLPPDLPWLIGLHDQIHMRPDASGRALVGGFLGHDEPGDPDGGAPRADAGWTSDVLAMAGRAFGFVDRGSVIRHSWVGHYPTTPDRHPIVDRLLPGLYAALGLSGTGLMHAPAAGALVTELVMTGKMDARLAKSLSANRFTGQLIERERTGF
jgi:sarcosine oxidase, subunit beta